MKKIIVIICVITLFFACKNEESDNNANSTKKTEEKITITNTMTEPVNPELLGTYVGNLPCETCDKIETHIILKQNNAYALTSRAVGDTAWILSLADSGTFNINMDILELTDIGGDTKKYKIEDKKLIAIDNDGDPITGDGENNYTFIKKQ